MKYLRYATLIASATALILLAIGTANALIEYAGLAAAFKSVSEDPTVLILAYYQTLGELGLNYEWFANYGPLAVVALLVTLLIASIP